MTKKLLLTTLLATCLVAGCGKTGIPQEDYDKVVKERDKLQSENENIEKMSELKVKIAEYGATINAEYKHAKFVLDIGGKVAKADVTENLKDVEELYGKATSTIDIAKSTFETINSLDDFNDDVYNTTVDTVDNVYNSWEEFYKSISNIEKAFIK